MKEKTYSIIGFGFIFLGLMEFLDAGYVHFFKLGPMDLWGVMNILFKFIVGGYFLSKVRKSDSQNLK